MLQYLKDSLSLKPHTFHQMDQLRGQVNTPQLSTKHKIGTKGLGGTRSQARPGSSMHAAATKQTKNLIILFSV